MYYADWLRAFSIHFVIMVHCVQINFDATDIYNPNTFERVPHNEEIIQKGRGFIKSLVQVGIPIFFYISGMATTFWNSEKKHFGQYVYQKFLRLLVPFFIAIPTILIPRLMMAQDF